MRQMIRFYILRLNNKGSIISRYEFCMTINIEMSISERSVTK